MQYSAVLLALFACLVVYAKAEEVKHNQQQQQQQQQYVPSISELPEGDDGTATHVRAKRTLLLKKKLLGAGLLGLGLGAVKGLVIHINDFNPKFNTVSSWQISC